jgi:hypothetical protein
MYRFVTGSHLGMYIGEGAIVFIIILILVALLLRRRRW